jgi:glutathione S-transferase
MPRLITIPISHYCEKARWALDRAGMAYREERHIQGIHRLAARRAGGGDTVPVLVTPDGTLGESEEIISWVDRHLEADDRLFPVETGEREEVLRLSRRFDGDLGVHGRRLVYVHMMGARKLALAYNNQGVPRWEDLLLRSAWPAMSGFVARELGIRPGIETADEGIVWREFDFAAEQLAQNGPFLIGERFTAADLTFAALSAPVIVPPAYGVELPQPEAQPPALAALVTRAREHPAGRYALMLFDRYRRAGRVPASATSAS